MYSEDISKIILAVWLHGEQLEDVALVPVGNFPGPYDAIAKDVRAGEKLAGLMKRHGAKMIADVVRNYYPEMYKVAVREVLQAEMHRTMPADATPEQIQAHAEKYLRYWAEPAKPTPLVDTYMQAIDKRVRTERIDTGFSYIDRLTYGITKGQLTIVGARPSVGKSSFCLQVAFNVARNGKKVLFLPLEMSAAETVDRLVARFTDVEQDILRSGKLGDKWSDVSPILDKIDGMADRFIVYENVRELSVIKALVQIERPDLIVIDQLSQIRNGDTYRTIREQYVEITRTLKSIALSEDVAIWLPCQMNRESSKGGQVGIDYLKESGSIEEDSDIVILLSRMKGDDDEPLATPAGQMIRLEIAKNRQGPCGSTKLIFNGPSFTFSETIPEGFYPSDDGEY